MSLPPPGHNYFNEEKAMQKMIFFQCADIIDLQ